MTDKSQATRWARHVADPERYRRHCGEERRLGDLLEVVAAADLGSEAAEYARGVTWAPVPEAGSEPVTETRPALPRTVVMDRLAGIAERLGAAADQLEAQLALQAFVEGLEERCAELEQRLAEKACCRGCLACAARGTWAFLRQPIKLKR